MVRPSRYIFHPGYNPKTEDNDIAILKLKRDVNFSPKVLRFVCLLINFIVHLILLQVWIISLPPDEATRDCQENEADTDFITIAREECDDEVKSGDQDYTYEYEEEYYEDGEEYENFEPGSFFQQTVDQFEEFQSGDIEYDYEYKDNCTTYYDGWWASIAGWGATYKFDGSCILRHARCASLSRRILLYFIEFLPGRRSIPITMSCVLMKSMSWIETRYVPTIPTGPRTLVRWVRYWTVDTHWSLISSYQGDSGSGLIVVSDTGPVLVGVVSYGWDCGDNRYEV